MNYLESRCACGNIAEPRAAYVDAQRCKSCWDRFSAPTQGADARPVAIYQIRAGAYRWDDVTKDAWEDTVDNSKRIVCATRDAAPSDAQDAERYRLIRQGKALTVRVPVKDKHVTYCIGDKPESSFPEAFDAAVDALIAASAPMEKT